MKFLRTPFFIKHLWWLLLKYIKSHLKVFCKKYIFETLAKFTGKHLYWSFFLIKILQLYLKSDSSTSVLLWILQNFKNTFCKEDPQATASGNKQWIKLLSIIETWEIPKDLQRETVSWCHWTVSAKGSWQIISASKVLRER